MGTASSRVTGLNARAVRFAKPLDHHSTRPGFQAPWGSHDPYQDVSRSQVVLGTTALVVVSYGLFHLMQSNAMKKHPKTMDPEWIKATIERDKKRQNLTA
eukprot:TRINITY_DN2130_c0_g1_i1.p1 TRINITY_DN2130_c0_g1~~TRINITY_DN2130_c0_g1_i1.p1  ORF type:complete len:114 (+),score=10.43 TRINITY_DN2130_c0_g1_i1:44-343(+)